jgi:Tfp pilus assembly protein PilX
MLMRSPKSTQRGITLFLSLIVLVAMMLSGIALFRTSDSAILVAGNIALQKSATRFGDLGTEHAVNRIITAGSGVLYTTAGGMGAGYVANALSDAPAATQTWAEWWDVYSVAHAPFDMAQDATTGNQVSYLIQRLCAGEGQPYFSTPCSGPPPPSVECPEPPCAELPPKAVYYRITNRISGPNNTRSFVQTLVSY